MEAQIEVEKQEGNNFKEPEEEQEGRWNANIHLPTSNLKRRNTISLGRIPKHETNTKQPHILTRILRDTPRSTNLEIHYQHSMKKERIQLSKFQHPIKTTSGRLYTQLMLTKEGQLHHLI